MRTLRPSVATLLLVASAALAEEPAPLHYKIEAEGSELAWELPATLHTVHGKAPRLEGTVDAEPGPGGKWQIASRFVVRAAVMATGNGARDRKMREQILETDRFPEIVFESRRFVADLSRFHSGERLTVEVTGELSIHGKTLPIRLPVDIEVAPDHVVLSGTFPVSWKQYELKDPSFGLIRVRDPIKVVFRFLAVPAADRP